jgi:hypothetical protein
MAQLDGARLVRFDADGLLYVWFGGHGVHAYDATGTEVDYWSCGDFAKNEADEREVSESMARRILAIDDLIERAEQEGYEHGVGSGSWVLDGNSTDETARRLLQGIEDGDPETLDALPSSPLSGEWADSLTPADVLAWFDLDDEHDAADDVLSAFEAGFSRGVVDEVERLARAIL